MEKVITLEKALKRIEELENENAELREELEYYKNRKLSGRQKHKPRTPEQVKSLVTRLNRIDGQILGIKKMIEENRYCPDVLMQVSAVQSSLNSFNKELLATHIKTCVVDDIRDGKEEAVDELCELLKKTMK